MDETAETVPPRAIFIVGVGRSGTTLLKALLDDHPQLLVLPLESKARSWHREPDPVAALWANSRYGRDFPADPDERTRFEAQLRRDLPRPVELATALRALTRAVALLRPVPGALGWVEKTPKHLRNVGELFAAFGASTRVICMVRDPRAVYASRARRWDRWGAHERLRFARRWAADDALTARFEGQPGFMALRFENLLRDPESAMRRVATHLGIAFAPSLLVPSREGRPLKSNSSFGSKVAGISADALERYREELDSREIAAIEELLGPRMRRRGYELSGPTRRLSWPRMLIGISPVRLLAKEWLRERGLLARAAR